MNGPPVLLWVSVGIDGLSWRFVLLFVAFLCMLDFDLASPVLLWVSVSIDGSSLGTCLANLCTLGFDLASPVLLWVSVGIVGSSLGFALLSLTLSFNICMCGDLSTLGSVMLIGLVVL